MKVREGSVSETYSCIRIERRKNKMRSEPGMWPCDNSNRVITHSDQWCISITQSLTSSQNVAKKKPCMNIVGIQKLWWESALNARTAWGGVVLALLLNRWTYIWSNSLEIYRKYYLTAARKTRKCATADNMYSHVTVLWVILHVLCVCLWCRNVGATRYICHFINAIEAVLEDLINQGS